MPELPSLSVTLLMDSVGTDEESSFEIVPTPCPSATSAPAALDRFTTKVSFGSAVVSPLTVTSIVGWSDPGEKLSVPDFAT